jgi:hypothetical protein
MRRKRAEKSGSVWKGLQNTQPSLFFGGYSCCEGIDLFEPVVLVTGLLFVCTFLQFQLKKGDCSGDFQAFSVVETG